MISDKADACPVCNTLLHEEEPKIADAKNPQVEPAQVEAQKTVQQEQSIQQQPKPDVKRGHNGLLIAVIIGVVLLLVGGAAGYFIWYIPYAKDRDALRTYVLATNVFLRSGQVAGVEYNVLDKIPYGSEIITYEKGLEWSVVKANGKEGFMASDYLLEKDEFDLLHGAWGDVDSKECIATTKCRRAILDFYQRNNLHSGYRGWQIYTKHKDAKPNSVFYPRLYDRGSKFTDFIFIVKNNMNENRMLACYSFEDETEKPIFRFSVDVPKTGYISNVQRTSVVTAIITFDNNEQVSVLL